MMKAIKKHLLFQVMLLINLCLYTITSLADEWPQTANSDGKTVTIYQPAIQHVSGDLIQAKAAISIKITTSDDPIFGSMWFTAQASKDQSSDIIQLKAIHITNIGWPQSDSEKKSTLTKSVTSAMSKATLSMSSKTVDASLKITNKEKQSLSKLKNMAPHIIFAQQLTVLINYDGKPLFTDIPDSDYMKAMNTQYYIVKNTKTNTYYLTDGSTWYSANDPLIGWKLTTKTPDSLLDIAPPIKKKTEEQTLNIITATTPTEVISTTGQPLWQPLSAGSLLYVKNTETPWLRDTSTGYMYVLLSGRWFKSTSTSGAWTFIRPDQLPADFMNIPPDSAIGGIRTSISGTPEANQSIIESEIPKTTAVNRKTATITVKYAGDKAIFKKIEGTNVSYAENTSKQVLKIKNKYYAVDKGIWFVATNEQGPWIVADSIPQSEISQIPPSSPVYNTTFVHIYDATPTVVYVGYLPGYMWSFPYYGVPVYGTGWYYPPYIGYPPYAGVIYYPRPPTWGLHVGYNSWTGWNVGVSWTNGFVSVGAVWHQNNYWGNNAWNHRHHSSPVIINNGNINIGNTINAGNRTQVNNHFKQQNINNRNYNNVNNQRINNTKRENIQYSNKKPLHEWSGKGQHQWKERQQMNFPRDNRRLQR